MPSYEFRCHECSHQFSVRVPWDKKSEVKCPNCGSDKLQEIFGLFNVPGARAKEVSSLEPKSGDEMRASLIARMKRIEGQARGIQKMLEEGRDCEDIIMQLSAIRAALAKVAMAVMAANLEKCLREDGDVRSREAIDRAKKIFLKFS